MELGWSKKKTQEEFCVEEKWKNENIITLIHADKINLCKGIVESLSSFYGFLWHIVGKESANHISSQKREHRHSCWWKVSEVFLHLSTPHSDIAYPVILLTHSQRSLWLSARTPLLWTCHLSKIELSEISKHHNRSKLFTVKPSKQLVVLRSLNLWLIIASLENQESCEEPKQNVP